MVGTWNEPRVACANAKNASEISLQIWYGLIVSYDNKLKYYQEVRIYKYKYKYNFIYRQVHGE